MLRVDDIRDVCQAGKDRDPGWYRIHRRLSIHITAFLLETPLQLKHVTLLMMGSAAVGAALLTSANLWWVGLAGVCLYLSFLLDKVDGEMARYRGQSSVHGILLDRFHHRLVEPLVFLALGWRAYQAGDSATPLLAALATMLAANIVEEHQQLPAFIAAKHARESRNWPVPERSGPPAWLARVAAVMRSLKTFRTFITVVPLALAAIAAETLTGRPVITWYLLASAVALWVYVVFQALYYSNGELDAELAAHTAELPPLPHRPQRERPTPMTGKGPTLTLVPSPRGKHKPGQAGGAPLVLLALLALAAGPAHAGTYYVDNTTLSCSNSGPGTQAQPYCTITAALAARGVAGNTIMVKAGNYPEQVTIPASGTSSLPLVLQAYGGPVVVDGADDFSSPSKWANTFGNVWRASTVTWSPKQVFADGARLTPSTAAPASLPAGSFVWVNNQGLYVNLGVSDNPGTHDLRVGRRNYAFVMSGRSWITIDGFTATRTEERTVTIQNNSNDVTFTNNTVTFSNKYGIYVSNSARTRIASCLVTDHNHHGIMLTSGTSQCVVEYNESARNALPGTRASNGLYMYGSINNIVRGNRWHHNQDTGQHMQSGSNNTISYNNISWSNGDHGFDHLGALNTFHTNDVAYGNFMDGFSIEGTATGTQLYNCISVDNGITTNEFDLWVDNASKPGFVSDDNIIWNSTGAVPIKYGTTLYSTLSAYRAASGQDSRSLQQDPRFVDPLNGNFHLAPGSPAIDNGNSSVANWPPLDAGGLDRMDDVATENTGLGPVAFSDRGALEFQPTGIAPTALLQAEPALGTAPVQVTLDASGSSDPDGSIVSYEFDFGDGVSTAPQAGPTAVHTYTAGSYTATVVVTDDTGLSASHSVVVVANARPVAALTASPASGKSPLLVNFDAGGSTDSDGSIATYEFDFGDGTVVGPQAGATVSHAYGTGNWRAQVTVTDNRGASDTLNTALEVAVAMPNAAPTAALSVTPAAGLAPLEVTADASGSSDPDGGIVSYQFTFPDGVVGPQPGATATRTLAAGTHVISLLVTDAEGATASASDTVVVTEPAADLAPVVTAPATVSVGEGGTLSLTVTAGDPDGQAITSLTANLDGLPAGHDATFTPSEDFTSGTITWHPTYGEQGSYPVTFTATNALAGQATTQFSVTHTDRAPVVSGPAEVLGDQSQPVTYSVTAADPDGEAIASLSADLSVLPADNPGTFTPGVDNTSGTFSWTPRAQDQGTYLLVVQASNALSGTFTTSVRINVADSAPIVTSDAAAQATENSPFSLVVTASDPDGEAITSLVADLSSLPAGHDATFTPDAGNLGGTLQWTPGFSDSGSYTVRFIAGNLLADTSTTVVHVDNVDRAPVVTVPAAAGGPTGSTLTLNVTAVDPDGDEVTSLAADLSQLPAEHTATFTLSGGASAGVLSWTPAAGDTGAYDVTFTGSNALPGEAVTRLTVSPPNQPPTARIVVTPATGNAPLNITADGSTSTDPEGGALSYWFDFGDGVVVGPQGFPTVTHLYAAGTWTLQLTVIDAMGAVHSTSTSVTATAAGPGPNLVTNPSFESGMTGWGSYSGGTLLRVSGGYDGNWAMQVTGMSGASAFGLNDSPNWVANTSGAGIGARYRFTAWVRAASGWGSAKIQVREYQGGSKIGPSTLSTPVPLSSTWQAVTVEHVVKATGTTLDFQVIDFPVSANEVFLIDNVSIHLVAPGTPVAATRSTPGDREVEGALTSGETELRFGARVSPTVVRADATLHFVTTLPGAVRVELFDASGRMVRSLLDDNNVAPGRHQIPVDGRSDRGDRLESGMYFYRVQATEQSAVGKLVFVR